ncbi:flavin-containing amine oxidoreductase-domain containing protein [Phascolomyces articulosus]|uniref:Flavin-containing amine oxidoreductase-domain containing protein n=1 Tax=Phascolomyces articulosus TaxID=60185 RepID=A0AAD5PAQ5_9FUNG|nr:flavin-containing amine oxidoreductase-domain containing protein [Phascolomyces articulosus]
MAAPASSGAQLSIDDSLQADSLTNIFLDYGTKTVDGTLTLSYGSCDAGSESTHIIGITEVTSEFQPTKFVWAVPSDAQTGCIFAKDAAGNIIAQSEPYSVSTKFSKRGHPEFEDMYFDAVKFHKSQMAKRDKIHASDKSEKIGIVGAGMSGLFAGLLLEQAGIHNYEILEANDRLGGRVHTTYFGNSSTAYQEMGPMRFPISIDYGDKKLPVTDHNSVFALAKELNKLNGDEEHKIEFIKWIQSTDNNLSYRNGVRLPDGRVPTKGQVAANATLVKDSGTSEFAAQVGEATEEFYTDDWFKLMSKDMYKAHAKALEEGYDDWSEWSWLHQKSGLSLNATDYATGLQPGNIWEDMYDTFTFSATDWRTIQGGLNRLAKGFDPVLGDKVSFGIKVSKLAVEDDGQVSVQWKDKPYDETYNSKSYDNVIVGVPFTIVRNWHLPELPYTLKSAIKNMGYSQACKVALEFSERFWEQYEFPIKGGCDSTDLSAGNICYPSNNFGQEGPGVMLASYSSGDGGLRFASMTEEQHVARVLEDIFELHGDIAKEKYTGNYDRVCWILDEFQSGSWAAAEPGQHKLYMPSYFEMNDGIVFVGEHTDIKHAWISAALESSIRGVAMVLVEHGHIKEAKQLVKKWDAKWMKI